MNRYFKLIFLLLAYNINTYVCMEESLLFDNVIFPNKDYSPINKTFSSYTIQYNNKTWQNTSYVYTPPFSVIYKDLYSFKKYKLRYKFMNETLTKQKKYKKEYTTSPFNVAYIDCYLHFNKSYEIVEIIWDNRYFNDNNSIFIDYYYNYNNKVSESLLKKFNAPNTISLNMTHLIHDYIVYKFDIIVKSNNYNISKKITLFHDDLVKLRYNENISSSELCKLKYCNNTIQPIWQVCINDKIYSSVCYAVCHHEPFTSPYDFVFCKNVSSTSSTLSTSQSSHTLNSTTMLPNASISNMYTKLMTSLSGISSKTTSPSISSISRNISPIVPKSIDIVVNNQLTYTNTSSIGLVKNVSMLHGMELYLILITSIIILLNMFIVILFLKLRQRNTSIKKQKASNQQNMLESVSTHHNDRLVNNEIYGNI